MSASISTSSASPLLPSSLRQAEDLATSWRAGLRPPPNMTVVDWAEQNRKLSKESSNGGRFIVARVEVARGPMLWATEPGVKVITLQACTQLLKTTFLENVAGYYMHLDPCPILVVQPKDAAAETFSKDRLAPMIRDTPVLRDIFRSQARDAGNTLTHKQFPGGHITMVGANSPTNLAMRPIRIVLFDEIDKYPLSAGNEGSPIVLAEERQAEFAANSLSARVCSPTVEGRSAIAKSYEVSDQRKPFVECPHCKTWQVLEWEQVRFEKDAQDRPKPDTAAYIGECCGVVWTEADRLRALERVTWRQTREFFCCGKKQKPEIWIREPAAPGVEYAVCSECGKRAVPNDHAGGIASKLYAPKQSIRQLVKKYRSALKAGIEELKTFYNTQLARTWKVAGEAPEWDRVYGRRGGYRSGTVPSGVLILFAGVDVQKDRLEISVWGFGRNRERWLIEHRVIPGQVIQQATWDELAKMFDDVWRRESGAEMSVRDWGIDSGAFAAEVGAFVRSQMGRNNVHAVDGHDNSLMPYIGVGALDVTVHGKKLRRGLKTVKVGSSYCKQELMGQLGLDRPEEGKAFPPGYVHLPEDVSEDQVKQLTSEELQVNVVRGRTRRTWTVMSGRRNEVLDCANYARALAAMRGWDRWRPNRFRELEDQLGVPHNDSPPPAGAPAAAAGSAPASTPAPARQPLVRRSSRSNYMD
ncbi:phage terminase large subunit family protein [Bradyrhizobium sp. 4]|nr:phage terminase large subunit family protein [Bradyrhizobium sp. 39]MCK1751246.1 phage terminase large subunit family protein [Bradyrhizobium sp. 135]UPJ38500.1 phage terminase large subunit family protein [Bradyrhizobium sp. 4]